MPQWCVYQLVDPRSGETRYIGMTSNEAQRRQRHRRGGEKTHCGRWKDALNAAGMEPVFDVIEVQESLEDAVAAEQYTIAIARSLGCDLTNLTDGGEGTLGWTHTPEWKAKNRSIKLGRKASPETIERCRQAQRSRAAVVFTPDVRAKTAAAVRERWKDPEHRRKVLDGMRRPEVLAKMRAPSLGRKLTREERAASAVAHGGRPFYDQFGRKWISLREAEAALGISSVCRLLSGETKRPRHGYTFTYEPPKQPLPLAG